MHVNEWDKVALAVQQWRRGKTRCVGDSWLFIVTRFMVVARIYREDLSRVTASHNRLRLSLSKHIRHGLIAKINDKRKLWTYEALDPILMNYSYARRVIVSIASPHHVMPHPARRASTCMCFSLSPFFNTHASV
jgi:hypothetical protein